MDLNSDRLVDGLPPRADMNEIEDFEKKRTGYFSEEFSKTALYWSSLCDVMRDNDGSTQAVLSYMSGKLEGDRLHSAAVYANADKIFGDKKGHSKLRHDKIRHAEQKAKQKGNKYEPDADAMKAGGPGKEEPTNTSVKALWELAEMECRAARYSDDLCDTLEQDKLLGKVKVMGKESSKRFKELAEEGDACLARLRVIDKCVGESYNKLRENLGYQLGGKQNHGDVWYLNTRYRTAVVHQKEGWAAVTNKLRDVFTNMKRLEAERRGTLRDFLVEANDTMSANWSKLAALTAPSARSANALDASQGAVDTDVTAKATTGVEEKRHSNPQNYQLAGTTGVICLENPPSDTGFIDRLTVALESPLIRFQMMVERRENKAIGSKYYPGLMVLTWDGFIHFFDLPHSSGLKVDTSPAAAFQDLSPSLSLDDLMTNKNMEDVLLVKSTASLEMDDDAVVDAAKSRSNKIEVKGTKKAKSLLGAKHKSVTFRTSTEAEMNHAVENIKACIQSKGGMQDKSESGYPVQYDSSRGGRSSLDSERSSNDGERSESGYTKQAYTRAESDADSQRAPAFEPTSGPLVVPTAGNPDIPSSVVYGSRSGAVASFASNPGLTQTGSEGSSSGDQGKAPAAKPE